MSDPYKVLGLTPEASDDEIKKAYRRLSRKYHPDTNVNNPNRDKAEEMFKLVQQAYEQIMDEKANGYSGSAYGQRRRAGGGFSSFHADSSGDYGDDQEAARMRAAVNFIQSMHFREAVNVLNSLSMHARTGQWYYLSAFANAQLGNNLTAMEHAQQAVKLEPDNASYRTLLNQLQYGGNWYMGRQTGYGAPVHIPGCNPSQMFTALCMARICCGSYGYAPIFCCI